MSERIGSPPRGRLVVRLFGDPELQFDGLPWPLKAPQRCYAILAMLPPNFREAAGRASVAAAVWPDAPLDEAMAKLRRHLHLLHRALPALDGIDWIASAAGGLSWNEHAPAWVDLHAFDARVAEETGRADAVELYRGPLLATITASVVAPLRERTRNACIGACRELALAERRRCALPEAIRYVDRILEMDACREDAVRLGMTLRYECGDRTSALSFFERFAARLREDMGIDPMPETLALRDAILMNRAVESGAEPSGVQDEPAAQSPLTPFVGRRPEFATLDAAWRQARGGKGSTMFVSGEAGMGKSRFVSEFASQVALLGGRIITGTTSNPERHPFEPLVDALRRGLAMLVESPVGQPWLSSVAELLPELRAAFHEMPEAEPLEPASARSRLLEAIARTIERIAKDRPLLLVLEDLHWAGQSTLDAVETIARRIGGVPALAVITYRTGDAPPGSVLTALRRRLLGEGRASSVELQALSFEDVASLVNAMPKTSDADAIVNQVYRVSEGNPLFACELVRGFVESGVMPDHVTVATIGRAIESRIDSLDATAKDILGVAATIGRSFTIDVLAGTLGCTEGHVIDALGELLDRRLIRAATGSKFEYSFCHELIARSVYAMMPPMQRTLYHRRIAAILSSSEGAEPLALASIARHWELGGDVRRAALVYSRAAHAAVAAHAPDEAIAYARSALGVTEDAGARFAMQLLIAIAERRVLDKAHWEDDLQALSTTADLLGTEERFASLAERAHYYAHVGREDEERAAIEAMLQLARELDPSKLGEACFANGMLEFHLGRFEAAIEPFERALSIALAAEERPAEARARSYLSRILFPLGRDREAREHYEELCRLSTTAETSTDLHLMCLYGRMDVAVSAQDVPLAQRTGADMLALAERLGDRKLEVSGNNLLAFAARWTATIAECRALHLRTTERSREIDYARGIVIGETNRSTTELSFGFPQQCLDIIEAIAPEADRLGDACAAVRLLCNRASALHRLNDPNAAIEAGRAAVERARLLDRRLRAMAGVALGEALCAGGDYDEGLALVESAVDLDRNTGSDARLMGYLSQFVLLLDEAGRVDDMLEAAAELAALSGRKKRPLWLLHPSRIAYALARAAARAGRDAQAGAYYAQGRAALAREIRRLGDDVAGPLGNLPFNRALLSTLSLDGWGVQATM